MTDDTRRSGQSLLSRFIVAERSATYAVSAAIFVSTANLLLFLRRFRR
jgi:hypothetical protein